MYRVGCVWGTINNLMWPEYREKGIMLVRDEV